MNALQTNHVLVIVIAALFILTAAVVVLVNVWRVRQERGAELSGGRIKKAGLAGLRRAEPALVRKIRAKNPGFQPDAFKRQTLSVCRQLGQAGTLKEIESMRSFITDSMLDNIRAMVKEAQNAASSGTWAKEQIREFIFADYAVTENSEQITLCVIAASPAKETKGDEVADLFKICMLKENGPAEQGTHEWLLDGFASWDVCADESK